MKTFKQIAAQVERIERLYYIFGCGTKKMIERVENILLSKENIGLCF